jgi:hypothetical protein
MLAQPQYLDVDKRLLANALVGPFDPGRGHLAVEDFVIYDGLKEGSPSHARGKWALDLMRTLGASESSPALRPEVIRKDFRHDIFGKAVAMVRSSDLKNQPLVPPPPFRESRVPTKSLDAPSMEAAPPSVVPQPARRPPDPAHFQRGLRRLLESQTIEPTTALRL